MFRSSWRGKFPDLRGVNIFVVDPLKCSVRQKRRFDTHGNGNAARHLSSYLQKLKRGSIIVGVTADEPTKRLASALPTLKSIGVNVADVTHRGAFAFLAQKGFPAKTVLRKARTWQQGLKRQPHFRATVVGTFVVMCR